MLKCIRNLFSTHTFRGKVESLSWVMLKLERKSHRTISPRKNGFGRLEVRRATDFLDRRILLDNCTICWAYRDEKFKVRTKFRVFSCTFYIYSSYSSYRDTHVFNSRREQAIQYISIWSKIQSFRSSVTTALAMEKQKEAASLPCPN